MNHFQRLNEVKELKIFFFAQRTNTQKQASSRRPLPCNAMTPTVQNHAGARCPDRTCQRYAQQTSSYNRTSLTSWTHRGSLSKRSELVLSSLPPPPPPFADSRPPVSKAACLISLYFALHLYVSYVQSHHCFSLATTTCTPEHPFSRLTAIRTHIIR